MGTPERRLGVSVGPLPKKLLAAQVGRSSFGAGLPDQQRRPILRFRICLPGLAHTGARTAASGSRPQTGAMLNTRGGVCK